ncbi:uncharacterized protein LOC121780992 isoform X2 [Salvia splendens]|uniref:uncharacterized protein LOC121780992 isoform X2 n=1 Tax=Salvia splendens TaxID=180675 RepID=UPI001C25786F|nr:uncharacterized protein LOC121780992 isoform X2 [Salvia splendens]
MLHKLPFCFYTVQEGVNANFYFLPFKPTSMKVLQCYFLSGMQLRKSLLLLKILQPKHVLSGDYTPQDILVLSFKENKSDFYLKQFLEIFRRCVGPIFCETDTHSATLSPNFPKPSNLLFPGIVETVYRIHWEWFISRITGISISKI